MAGTSIACAVPPAVAARYGLVTGGELLARGLSHSAIAKQVARGVLRRWYRGVYSYGPGELSREAGWLAAVLAAGPGAVLSHQSCAVLYGVWRRQRLVADVLAPRGRRPRGPVQVRSYRHLDPADVTVRMGIPVTTMARLLVDLTDVTMPQQLTNVMHEADFRKLLDIPATFAAMDRANGRRNLHVLDRALGLLASGGAGSKSGKEDRFLALLQYAGLPEPLVNTRCCGEELDCYWPQLALNVEIDGPGHLRPRSRREDRERDARLAVAGIAVLRVPTTELDTHPRSVVDRLLPWFR